MPRAYTSSLTSLDDIILHWRFGLQTTGSSAELVHVLLRYFDETARASSTAQAHRISELESKFEAMEIEMQGYQSQVPGTSTLIRPVTSTLISNRPGASTLIKPDPHVHISGLLLVNFQTNISVHSCLV